MTALTNDAMNRLAAMILLITRDASVGRTALNNLLYLIDVAHFAGYQQSVSRAPYLRLLLGPTPPDINVVRRILINRHYLMESVLESEIGWVFRYRANGRVVDFNKVAAEFTAAELATMRAGIARLRPLPREVLCRAVRSFEPWVSGEAEDELPFFRIRDDRRLAVWLAVTGMGRHPSQTPTPGQSR